MSYNAETVPDLLGPEGPLAAELAAYEDRPYQREMALEVARLLEDGGRLAAEAPTGIGKSLGYGLPAAAWAAAGNGPVVISTHTKALQEQLLHLEAPRLRQAVDADLRVRVLKGRSNYLCRRRYEAACSEAKGDRTTELLRRLRPWVESTESGDWGECGESRPRDLQFLAVRVASEPRFCAHSGCTPADGCFFKRARATAATADLLVVNHALLAIHLFGGYEILPAFDALVVDEGHAFVRVALDHLTVSVGPARLAALIEAAPGGGGFWPDVARSGEGASRVAAMHRSMAGLEETSRAYFGKANGARPAGDDRQRYRDAEEFSALCPLSPELMDTALGTLGADVRALESFVEQHMDGQSEVEASFLAEVRRFHEETQGVKKDFTGLAEPDSGRGEYVTWKEWGADDVFSLSTAPLEIGPRLEASLSEGPRRLIFTSATLAAGKDFTYFSREVGMEGALPSVVYPSPFDFQTQALVVAVQRGPDPRESGWAESTAATLESVMRDPGRKTMALFTSYRDLTAVQRALRAPDPDGENGAEPVYDLFAQGAGTSAARLLERFRKAGNALLLGTASFWEGVDLPGDDLEVLVLTRLPFGVPTEPRFQARAERIEEEGGNAFTALYLPEAVLRFKQGFGRLIRRRSDRGVVAVLDPRLLGKSYGRRFASALPLPVTAVADGPALSGAVARWWHSDANRTQGETP